MGLRYIGHQMHAQKRGSNVYALDHRDEDDADDNFVSLDDRNAEIEAYKEYKYSQIKCKQNNEHLNALFKKNSN